MKKLIKIILLIYPFLLHSNEFESSQWALLNDGADIEVLATDINTQRLKAIKGEDIGLRGIIEKDQVIKIAVIDSGIDLSHPDLINKISYKKSECEVLEKYKQCLADADDL